MTHDYTARRALELILNKLRDANPDLAARAQIAIDAGVDEVAEQDIQSGRGLRGKTSKREYRKNRPLTDPESIDAVLGVLEAHLVVHRRVVNSALNEFALVAIGNVQGPSSYEPGAKQVVEALGGAEREAKKVEIEVVPQSARPADDRQQTIPLEVTEENELSSLTELIGVIRNLTRFED